MLQVVAVVVLLKQDIQANKVTIPAKQAEAVQAE
jgi:hypothetical protein